jgi:hypothetical protein
MTRATASEETRRAVRWVHATLLVGVLLYLACSAIVRRDDATVRIGRSMGMEFAWVRADTVDRGARWGDAPVVWCIGSSITRDAIDEELLAELLAERGYAAGVEKYGFASGAPVFTRAITGELPIRAGDVVVTTVAFDNFARDWIAERDGLRRYVEFLLPPGQVLAISEIPWHLRVEYALAALPPRDFWRYRETFQNGFERRVARLVRGRAQPRARERHYLEPYDRRALDADFRDDVDAEARFLGPERFAFEAGQVNHDALLSWVDDVQAREAVPWVVHVPHHPEYHERLIDRSVADAYHAELGRAVPIYEPLTPIPADGYIDYKHANAVGRAALTRELAERLTARR